MTPRRPLLRAFCFMVSLALPPGALAAEPVRVGELNSYKTVPAFLEPYRKGWQMALDEVNEAGGVLDGRSIEVVSRDDGGNPADAVRAAEELVAREGVGLLFGTFLSNVGLAIADYARQREVFFLAAEPLTDKLVWEQGNAWTFRLRPSTYMQTLMLVEEAAKAGKTRWALVYPNYEYGQSAADSFKQLLKERQPEAEIVAEQAQPLGKIDAGAVAQALADAEPDAVFSALFAADLAKFVREGTTRGLFEDRLVLNLLGGEPEYLDPLGAETPEGWIVTGYPWRTADTPNHAAFLKAYQERYGEPPRAGSLVGYISLQSLAAGIEAAGSAEAVAVAAAFKGLSLVTPVGPITYRAIDHQSTMGAWVGRLGVEDGQAVMTDARYVPGDAVLPPDEVVRDLRPGD